MGCTANAILQAFDPVTEDAEFCSMSIAMHATDFDGLYSREMVKNWNVNGFLVSNQCNPQAQHCNETWRPLYPCLTDFPVQVLLQGHGSMNISGTLSDFVDECPYKGNLLSGVVFVTCMVRPSVMTKTTARAFGSDITPLEIFVTASLQCATAGCIATQKIMVNSRAERCNMLNTGRARQHSVPSTVLQALRTERMSIVLRLPVGAQTTQTTNVDETSCQTCGLASTMSSCMTQPGEGYTYIFSKDLSGSPAARSHALPWRKPL